MNRRQTHPALLPLLAVALLAPPTARPAGPPRPRTDSYGDPLPPGAIARIGTVRFRHVWATEVFFLNGGKALASLGGGELCLWDATTGRLLRTTRTGRDQVRCAALSPRGDLLALAGEDGSVGLYDPVTGKELRRVRTPLHDLASLAFSPDGKVLAARACFGPAPALWEVSSGKPLSALAKPREEEGEVLRGGFFICGRSLAFSPGGERLAAATEDGLVCLWRTAGGKLLFQRRGARGTPSSIAFSPDGKWLAWQKRDGRLCVVAADTGKERRVLRKVDSSLLSLTFSPDGTKLASVHNHGVWLWDVSTGELLRQLQGDLYGVTFVAFSPDGRLLASAAQSRIRRWEVATGKECPPPGGELGLVLAVAVSGDGRCLAVGTVEGALGIWDAATGSPLRRLAEEGSPVAPVAFSPDGKDVAAEDLDGLALWDVVSGKRWKELGRWPDQNPRLFFRPDGARVVRAANGGELCVWDRATGKLLRRFVAPEVAKGAGEVGVSADGRTLAVAGRSVVRCWDTLTGRSYPSLKASGAVEEVALSPDGRTLAVLAQVPGGRKPGAGQGAGRWLLTLAEVATGRPRAPARAVPAGSHRLTFSPDGRALVFVSGATVRVREVASAKEVARLRGHRGWVYSLAFDSGGKVLASGGADTTALVWDFARLLPRAAPRALPPRRLEGLWEKLADADAARAYEAVCALADARCTGFLGGKIAEVGRARRKAQGRYARLIKVLGSDDFRVRERAFEDLAKAGDRAEPALRRALAGGLSVEARRRVERLLGRVNGALPSAGTLRLLRGVEALERLATGEARATLAALAREGEPVGQEAKAALWRLEGRRRTAEGDGGRSARGSP